MCHAISAYIVDGFFQLAINMLMSYKLIRLTVLRVLHDACTLQ
jgi:hypothetical protein